MDDAALQRPSVTAVLLTLDAHQRFDFSNRNLASLASSPGSRLLLGVSALETNRTDL